MEGERVMVLALGSLVGPGRGTNSQKASWVLGWASSVEIYFCVARQQANKHVCCDMRSPICPPCRQPWTLPFSPTLAAMQAND